MSKMKRRSFTFSNASGELDVHCERMRQQARDVVDAPTGPVAALG